MSQVNHNPNWPCIPDYPYSILIIGSSGSGKTIVSLNLVNQQQHIYKMSKIHMIKVSVTHQQKRKSRYLTSKKIKRHSLLFHNQLMMSENLED